MSTAAALAPAESDRALRAIAGSRLVFVLPGLEMGGAERQALLLAEMFSAAGAHVSMFGLGAHGSVSDAARAMGMECVAVPLPPPGSRAAQVGTLVRFAAALRRRRPTCLLPYGFVPNVWCGATWRWTGARGTIWNQRSEGIARTVPWLEQLAVRLTPSFVANSDTGRAFLVADLGVEPARAITIPNGVRLAAARRPRAQWREQCSAHGLLLVMVANLTTKKDHATLLDAFALVQRAPQMEGRSVTLALAGYDGDAAEAVRSRVEREFPSSVRLLGATDDVAGLLYAADAAVLSSRSEGSPNGVLEPMAAGLAVVGTDIPGIRDALGAGQDEMMAPPGDAAGMAAALIRVLSDDPFRAARGRGNAERVAEEFSPHRLAVRMAHQVIEVTGFGQGP